MLSINQLIKKLPGPIMIFGVGGFVGINLLNLLLKKRDDVFGVSTNPGKSWRITQSKIDPRHIVYGNLLDKASLGNLIKKYQPKTIFNLAAYGAYSKQNDQEKIYLTNFNSTVNLIEILKKYGFKAYIHAGSQSEYGLNSCKPKEIDELIPNSHYAVSKAATYHLLKYYGRVENLPVVHLRLYSVYGPWEEPDRLMPVLIDKLKQRQLPDFVDPLISRDFIYVDDVIEAMIVVAAKLKKNHYGDVFNVATGRKTTIKKLAELSARQFNIQKKPVFGTMKNKGWDLKDWYGNSEKMRKVFGWKAKISLKEGLIKFFKYERND